MADIRVLQAERDRLTDELTTANDLKESADKAARLATAQAEFATSAGSRASFESSAKRAQGESQRQAVVITRLTAQLATVNAQIAALQREQAAPRQSAGDTVAEDQAARAEGASVTNPPRPALRIDIDGVGQPVVNDDVEPTNADRTPTSTVPGSSAEDRGLNDPVRRQNQTQSTPATLPEPGPVRPSAGAPQPGANGGTAAPSDDVRASINAIFGGENAKIITQDNVLDRYASYSYAISIYLMSPADYARLVRTKNKNLAGYNLLIQSAGIPVSTGFGSNSGAADVGEVPGATTRSLDAGRNEYFQEDFYIDDLRIKSLIPGKGTQGPHNAVSLDFRIVEPNGISLLPRLYKATQAYVASTSGTGDQNYAAQNFLMVIRFYGYDVNGNQYLPITGTRNDAEGNPVTIPTTIEKFIPFQFTNIKFRIADKLTEYTCEAVCPQNLIATGPARGVIPYNVEITSKTLQELFNGPVAFSQSARAGTVPAAAPAATAAPSGPSNTSNTSQSGTQGPPVTIPTTNTAPPKASAASTPTITQGLAQALNKYQADLVQQGVYNIPDSYRIEIVTPALQNSKVVPPGEVNQRKVPMGAGSKAPANQQKNPATQSQNKDAGTTSALAGMSIMQFIDQYTRTSTYIYAQQTKIRDQGGIVRPNGTPAEVTAWYRVGLQATPRESAGYDSKRNDYAYDIVYQLAPYKVNDVQSDYFPQAQFNGAHKKYNYWFTGQNTQILKFEQDFNYLYYLTVNTDQPTVETGLTTDYREYLKKSFSPRSAQSSMGQSGATNEPSANAADYLYSPADQARIRLEILGDPAWLQQGELWGGIAGAGLTYDAFLEDGTINYEGQEPLFEVAFNQPVDYNLDTGVMDPTTKNFNRTDSNAGDARQSYIYRAVDCTSTFSQGRFTQELNGVLILFDLPARQAAKTEQDQRDRPASPNESGAETRRLLQQATAGSFADRQQQAAGVLGAARREQYGRLLKNPLGTVFGLQPSDTPLATDSLATEGFGDPTATSTPPAPAPPTSGGQPVGAAASGSAAVSSQGGASGRAVGQPVSVQVATINPTGQETVSSNAAIQELFTAQRITAQGRDDTARALAIKQRAAEAPVTNQAPQSMVREY